MSGHSVTASESSARVVPGPHTDSAPLHDHNPVQRRSTRDDPDEESENEFSQSCRLKARWVNIAVCFGVELQDVFKIGRRLNYESNSDMHDVEKEMYRTAYQKIIEFIPGLKRFLLLNGDNDSEKVGKLAEIMQKGCNTARSDTFKRINQFTDKYLNSGTRPIVCLPGTMRKTSRGLNHPQIGRLIIPAKYVVEWDESPESSRAHFDTGHKQIMGYNMPVFLYYEYKYNPEEPDEGLFRSAFLVCVLVDILYGPHAVDTVAAKRSELYRHHCIGDMYDAEAITAQMIAYSAVVARFALSSRRMWNYKEDAFEYQMFYHAIVMRLSDPSDPWVENLFKWWNVRVFGKEEGKISVINMDDQEQDEWKEFVQRKEARKARNTAAAVNSTALSESVEQPVGEVPLPSANSTPPSSPPTPVINPTLLTMAAPNNAMVMQVRNPMPEAPNASTSNPEHEPSPLGNPPDEITQVHNPMPEAPNASTSNPERELSPLSNPPDEESSMETIGAPSSYPRKRKSAKNNTGKAKAPPKQRRKTAAGSQSRSTYI